MDEYLCLTLVSRPGENQAHFAGRLSQFWTRMLRERQADFENVYAEATRFERQGDCWTRQYLVAEAVVELLERELDAEKVTHDAVNREEAYSRYEATPPDWMQVEH